MAEIGVVASVIQVAGAGLKLSQTLYQYADGVATADRRIKDIAKDVQLTSFIIEELANIFKLDSSSTVLSEKAIKTADDTVKECSDVFKEINKAITKTQKSSLGKILLPFRDPKLELLRTNIDRLKANLQLLMQVLTHAHQIASQKLDREAKAAQRDQIKALIQTQRQSTKRYEESLRNFNTSGESTLVSDDEDAPDGEELPDADASPTTSRGMVATASAIGSSVTTKGLEKCVHHIQSLLKDIEKLQQVLSCTTTMQDSSDHHESAMASYFRARETLDTVILGTNGRISSDKFQIDPGDEKTPGKLSHMKQFIGQEAQRILTGATLRETTLHDSQQVVAQEALDFNEITRLEEDFRMAIVEAEEKVRTQERQKLDKELMELKSQVEKSVLEKMEAEAKAKAVEEKIKSAEDASKAKELADRKLPIMFKDAIGRTFTFPWERCKTWAGMEELIKSAFKNDDALRESINKGLYDLIGPHNTVILPLLWDYVVQPGYYITMSMVYGRSVSSTRSNSTDTGRQAERLQPSLTSSVGPSGLSRSTRTTLRKGFTRGSHPQRKDYEDVVKVPSSLHSISEDLVETEDLAKAPKTPRMSLLLDRSSDLGYGQPRSSSFPRTETVFVPESGHDSKGHMNSGAPGSPQRSLLPKSPDEGFPGFDLDGMSLGPNDFSDFDFDSFLTNDEVEQGQSYRNQAGDMRNKELGHLRTDDTTPSRSPTIWKDEGFLSSQAITMASEPRTPLRLPHPSPGRPEHVVPFADDGNWQYEIFKSCFVSKSQNTADIILAYLQTRGLSACDAGYYQLQMAPLNWSGETWVQHVFEAEEQPVAKFLEMLSSNKRPALHLLFKGLPVEGTVDIGVKKEGKDGPIELLVAGTHNYSSVPFSHHRPKNLGPVTDITMGRNAPRSWASAGPQIWSPPERLPPTAIETTPFEFITSSHPNEFESKATMREVRKQAMNNFLEKRPGPTPDDNGRASLRRKLNASSTKPDESVGVKQTENFRRDDALRLRKSPSQKFYNPIDLCTSTVHPGDRKSDSPRIPDYSDEGWADQDWDDEWPSMRHHHPTRLSGVPEEDEKPRPSSSRASQVTTEAVPMKNEAPEKVMQPYWHIPPYRISPSPNQGEAHGPLYSRAPDDIFSQPTPDHPPAQSSKFNDIPLSSGSKRKTYDAQADPGSDESMEDVYEPLPTSGFGERLPSLSITAEKKAEKGNESWSETTSRTSSEDLGDITEEEDEVDELLREWTNVLG